MAQARILNASWHRFMRRKLETLAMQEARQKSCQKKLDETNLDFDISMCGYSLQDTVCILLYMYAYKWIYIYIYKYIYIECMINIIVGSGEVHGSFDQFFLTMIFLLCVLD